MNTYEWIMAERVALITTLVMDLNSRSDEFTAVLNYSGYVNKVHVVLYKKINNEKYDFSAIFRMYTYLDEHIQNNQPKSFCTIDQIIHILNQIIKCFTENECPVCGGWGQMTNEFPPPHAEVCTHCEGSGTISGTKSD